MAKYVLSSLSLGSERTKFEIFCEHVAYLHSMLLLLDLIELIASTENVAS